MRALPVALAVSREVVGPTLTQPLQSTQNSERARTSLVHM